MTKKHITKWFRISVVLCIVPMALSAHQSELESALKGCASIDNDEKRLSCYDQALRPMKVADDNQSPSATQNSNQPEPVAPSQTQPEAVVNPSTEAEKAAVQEKQPAEVVKDEPLDVEKFGLKEKQPRETVHIKVTVKEVRKNLTNRFIFITTNGQVWLQVDTRNLRFPDVPFDAEIRSASLGSFYLKPNSSGASVRVSREK